MGRWGRGKVMAGIRHGIGVLATVATATLVVVAQPAAAFHRGATADCGDAGVFTVRATPNGAGFESPSPNSILLFEEGGTLSIRRAVRDGVLVWDSAAVGMAHNNVDEVTCSITLANGVHLVVTGVYTGP
jgi:hypothetical protein